MILPVRLALFAAMREIKQLRPEDIRGHLSRRHARRAVDRYRAALLGYMEAYQEQYGSQPRLWRCSLVEDIILHAGIIDYLSGRRGDEDAER